MGVDKSAVSRFEKIDANPRMSTLRAYAYAIEAMVYMHAEADRPHIYMNTTRGLGNNLWLDTSASWVELQALTGPQPEWNIEVARSNYISQPQNLIEIVSEKNDLTIESSEQKVWGALNA